MNFRSSESNEFDLTKSIRKIKNTTVPMGQFWPAVVHGFGLAQLLGWPGQGLQPTYESRGARSMVVG
jgi:hypothetical protein